MKSEAYLAEFQALANRADHTLDEFEELHGTQSSRQKLAAMGLRYTVSVDSVKKKHASARRTRIIQAGIAAKQPDKLVGTVAAQRKSTETIMKVYGTHHGVSGFGIQLPSDYLSDGSDMRTRAWWRTYDVEAHAPGATTEEIVPYHRPLHSAKNNPVSVRLFESVTKIIGARIDFVDAAIIAVQNGEPFETADALAKLGCTGRSA